MITDFGLSKLMNEEDPAHNLKTACGTPGYVGTKTLCLEAETRACHPAHTARLAHACERARMFSHLSFHLCAVR